MFFLAILFGPWITDMGLDGFSVLWTTDTESIGWVQMEDGTRIFDEFAGRRMPGKFHSVRISGLDEGAGVTCYVGGMEIAEHSNPRRPVYGDEVLEGPFTVRTFSRKGDSCRFAVLNDIHMDTALYEKFVSGIDAKTTDFVLLNGDIMSAGHHPLDSIVKYEIAPLGSLAGSVPIMFARGNHEGRGRGVRNVAEVFPNSRSSSPELPFNRLFRNGPAAFLVLDAGETGVRNSIALSGDSVYVGYLQHQMEWVRKAVRTPLWRRAKVRICFIHVPMAYFGDPSEYVVQTWMNRNFLPLLNRVGVDLMISADYHEYEYHPAGSMGNTFPIIVNDDESRLETVVKGKRVDVTISDPEGRIIHRHIF